METTGALIRRLRLAKGWKKRPPLVAALQERGIKITAESIRQYEEEEIKPGREVRAGLAAVFKIDEREIEFPGRAASSDRPHEGALIAVVKRLTDDQQRLLIHGINRRLGLILQLANPMAASKKRKRPQPKGKR